MKIKRLIAGLLVLVMCFTCVGLNEIDAQAASGKYWVKVNYQANVATVYKRTNGEWKPVKAMLTSCGTNTPKSGSYNTITKYRWRELMGPSYGQYSTRIVGSILFHSVWYYSNGNRKTQSVKEFNKLGTTASHGCVRLSTADSKWIYDNCAVGTKVTFYKSSNPGPLGKPAAYKMPSSAGKMNWDPTDVSSSNPYYQTKPVLTQKYKTISYGSKNDTTRELVTAKQQNGKALKSLTATVKKWSSSQDKYVSAKFDNKKEGTYKITYKAVGSKGVSITKTFKYLVKDTAAPTIKASDRTVALNTVSAVKGMSAKMKNGTSRTTAARVYIKTPGSDEYGSSKSYEEAKKYKFTKTGTYKVKYKVKCKNKTLSGKYNESTKTIDVTVKKPTIKRKYSRITRGLGNKDLTESYLKKYVTATDYDGSKLAVSVSGVEDIDVNKVGNYTVTYTAVGENNIKVTTKITVAIAEVEFVPNEGQEKLENGMTIFVPAMDEASVKEVIEARGKFQYTNGISIKPTYTIDEAAATCTITFANAPSEEMVLRLEIPAQGTEETTEEAVTTEMELQF